MEKVDIQITISLLVGGFVSLIFGAIYLIAAEWWIAVVEFPFMDPIAWRMVGALMMALAIAQIKAWKEGDWDKQENILIMGSIWCILGSAVSVWAIVVHNAPVGTWINIALLFFFAINGILVLVQKMK